MSDRIERDELVRLVAQRTGQDVGTVDKVVDAFLDEIYERLSAAMKRGQGVTLKVLAVSLYAQNANVGCSSSTPARIWRRISCEPCSAGLQRTQANCKQCTPEGYRYRMYNRIIHPIPILFSLENPNARSTSTGSFRT